MYELTADIPQSYINDLWIDTFVKLETCKEEERKANQQKFQSTTWLTNMFEFLHDNDYKAKSIVKDILESDIFGNIFLNIEGNGKDEMEAICS